MDRRRYLVAVGATASAVSSGCLGRRSGREGLSIEGTAPTLSPGTDTVIAATAYNADSFRFRAPEVADLSRTDATVSPSPARQADSFPPIWVWAEPEPTVEAELTVAVPSDADVGEYTYGVTARNGSRQQEAEYAVTVED